jgi:pimeloyl-ACP methyl ester carboxylesterase
MLTLSPDSQVAETAFEDGYEARFTTASDGCRLFHRDYNPGASGTPVLCLTGITRNSRDFHRLALHLADKGRRVIVPDYRGRGRSAYDPNWRSYRPIRLLRDINGLLHALHVPHTAVIGTSLGGLLLMGLAGLRPGLIQAAVINDIGPDLANNGVSRIVAYVGQDHPQQNWDQAIHHLQGRFPLLGLSSDEEWRDMAEGSFRWGEDGLLHIDWDPAIAKCLEAGAKSPVPLWLLFRALKHTPTLVIRGGKSDVLTEHTFDHMAEVHHGLKRLVIPDAGHTPTLNEEPCRKAIDELLGGIH